MSRLNKQSVKVSVMVSCHILIVSLTSSYVTGRIKPNHSQTYQDRVKHVHKQEFKNFIGSIKGVRWTECNVVQYTCGCKLQLNGNVEEKTEPEPHVIPLEKVTCKAKD